MTETTDDPNGRWPFVLMCDGLFMLSTFLPWLKVWQQGSPNFWTIMGKAPLTLGYTMLVGISGALASIVYTLISRHRLQATHLMYFTAIRAMAPGTLVFMALARPFSDAPRLQRPFGERGFQLGDTQHPMLVLKHG